MKLKSIALAAAAAGLIALPVLAHADDAKAPAPTAAPAAATTPAQAAESHADKMFNKIDANHDGKISHEEWTAHSDAKFKHISGGAADITKEAWDKWQKEEEAEDKAEAPKAGK